VISLEAIELTEKVLTECKKSLNTEKIEKEKKNVEHKSAEEALRESDVRFQLLSETND